MLTVLLCAAHRKGLNFVLRASKCIKLLKGSKFVPHVLKEISSSVKPNNLVGNFPDNDINTSTCRLREQNNNTINKNCDTFHTICRESFCKEMWKNQSLNPKFVVGL
jgi:hypothetical protein